MKIAPELVLACHPEMADSYDTGTVTQKELADRCLRGIYLDETCSNMLNCRKATKSIDRIKKTKDAQPFHDYENGKYTYVTSMTEAIRQNMISSVVTKTMEGKYV
jgi:hypothetical protein